MTTADTALVCLLGHPVEHSVSPQIHSAAFKATGVDAVYVACDVHDVAGAITGLRALGALGANVTVPHKRAVWELIERRTAEAELVGAANTVFVEAGGAFAVDNTDVAGLVHVLGGIGLEPGDGVVIYGAGGAARAAAVAVGRLGRRVRVEARRQDRAEAVEALAHTAGALPLPGTVRPRLVVNATPLGLQGERLPDRFHALESDQVALDLVYGARPSPFLADARARGARAVDGLGMLVAQAAAAFERWTGRAPPQALMQRAALQALGRQG